ncbi:MAG: hypothetical protein V4722_04310 [Bacteroidota bacterium]
MIGEVVTSQITKPPVDKIKLVDFSISQYTTPIRYFNSIAEIVAGLDYDNKPKYYDPKNYPTIIGIVPAQAFLKILEDLQNVTSARAIAAKVGMNMVGEVNGKSRYFKYLPGKMLIQFRGIKESEAAAIAKQKDLQAECDKVTNKARLVFDKLQTIGKMQMDPDMRVKYVNAVAIYNATIFDIQQTPGIKAELKKFETVTVSGIGVVPVIVWAVVWIVGILGSVYLIATAIEKVKKHQAILDAQAKNVEQILQAGMLYKAGKIDKATMDKAQGAALQNLKTNNTNLTTLTNADSKSTLDKLTTIAAITAGGFILYKIL